MRLYHHPFASNARRALLVAEQLGIALELVELNLMDPDDRRRLEQVNPNSKLPVLTDGDFVLWESCAIMQYLCDITPGQTLYPQDARLRADVNRWLFWISQHFGPALRVLVWENVWKGMTGNGAPDPQVQARGAAEIAPLAALIDAQLTGRRWVTGETLTLADFALASSLIYLDQARLPVTGCANLMAWYARVQALDVWQRAA
ncbi:MAG: glutathione S-transferase family protein, partial [Pseudomonadota bacterium]|nr:glutathione S-transferase family protein [Pseudomonadota bacterium]